MCRPDSIRNALVSVQPDFVINAAAYTAVDKAEEERAVAFSINSEGAGNVARVSAEHGVPIIHVSTDYVFSGETKRPYLETDIRSPINVYGKSKAEGEQQVRKANPNHLILRTAWVFSPYGNNFLRTMLRLAETRETISVVNDQVGTPTYALHLAEALLNLSTKLQLPLANEKWGVYHLAGSGEATWYEFAREIFAAYRVVKGSAPDVKPITTADYPTPARRPKNSRLDCTKLETNFGIRLPAWQVGVRDCMRSLGLVAEIEGSGTGR